MSTKPKFSSLELPKPNDKSLDRYVETRGAPVLTKSKQSEKPSEAAPVSAATASNTERKPTKQTPQPSVSQRTHSIRTEVPNYLAKALRLSAAERDCTIRYLLLEALQAQGYAVEASDLTEDGRRPPMVTDVAEGAK